MKIPRRILPILGLFYSIFLISSCSSSTTEQTFDSSKLRKATQEEIEKVIEQFVLAEDSSVIEIPAGFFALKTQLILDNKNHITIKGAGLTETVLSFRDLKAGGEGVKLVGNNITIQELHQERHIRSRLRITLPSNNFINHILIVID